MILPEKIRRMVAEESGREDDIGMSGASILIYGDKVLKVQDYNEEARNEYQMYQYLQGRLPVPDICFHEVIGEKSYLLMSRCEGQMACAGEYMADPALQCRLLADGLRKLWSTEVSGCPSDQRLSQKLRQAKYNIENGLVDLENVEPDTFGENGFRDPVDLLDWLYANMPQEEPVLSHGDYCLPNLFGVRGEVTGYIDLGRAGIADKWCDIALCYRSLSHNYSGKYSGKACAQYDDLLLFRELDMEPEWEKIHYYILLDELF